MGISYHVANIWVGVVDHRVLKRPEEILLELEMRELLLFQKAHSQLTEGVESEKSDMRVIMTTHLIEVLAKNIPEI